MSGEGHSLTSDMCVYTRLNSVLSVNGVYENIYSEYWLNVKSRFSHHKLVLSNR